MDKQRDLSNFQLFVKNYIAEINRESLAKRFADYMQHTNKKKVGMRIDYDLYLFYMRYNQYQTAINTALRVVKEAVETGEMKLS